MIPKKIIQTHYSEESLKEIHRVCRTSLENCGSGYEYLFFSDQDCLEFISYNYPGFLPLWKIYPRGVQKSDFFRVLAVYHFGGFYADMDVYFHNPIEELLSHSLIFPLEWVMPVEIYRSRHRIDPATEDNLKQIGNYAFGAEKNHWFLREVIMEMVARTSSVDLQNLTDNDVLYSTGPDLLNSVYQQHMARLSNCVTILEGEECPLPPLAKYKWGQPSWFQFGKYGNHLMSGVWRA